MHGYLKDALEHLRSGSHVTAIFCLWNARQFAERDGDLWKRIHDMELDLQALINRKLYP